MNRIRMLAAALLLCGLCTGLAGLAFGEKEKNTDKKAPNVQESAKGAKETDKTKGIDDLALASKLIQYGRKEKHPESLLIAAQILHKNPTEKLTVGSKVTGEATKSIAVATYDDSPKALVAEAKKLSSSAHVASLAAATLMILDEEPRGPAGGPSTDFFTIQPGQRITWNPITFIGLQRATVHIDNRVFGNMLLEIFDEFGNRVAFDGIPGTFFNSSWTPAFNGPFTIRLTNRDTIAFNCSLRAS